MNADLLTIVVPVKNEEENVFTRGKWKYEKILCG